MADGPSGYSRGRAGGAELIEAAPTTCECSARNAIGDHKITSRSIVCSEETEEQVFIRVFEEKPVTSSVGNHTPVWPKRFSPRSV